MPDNEEKDDSSKPEESEAADEDHDKDQTAPGSPGSRIQKLRKTMLIVAVIAIVGGVVFMYSEDLLQLVVFVVGPLFSPAGSSYASIMSIVSSDEAVKAFQENSTDSTMHVSFFEANDAMLIFEQMRSDCNLTGQTDDGRTMVYRVMVDDAGTNRSLYAWVDGSSKGIICIARKGNWTIACRSHAYSQCHDNNFYWYNSCGEMEEMKLSCFGICRNNTCMPDCVLEGQASRPSENLTCCDGLESLPNFTVSDNECGLPINQSFICPKKCGNGLCQPPENLCNCPADCSLNCTDSDGMNYYSQGKAIRGEVELWDECFSENSVTEFYCEYNAIRNITIECPLNDTCYYGRCMNTTKSCIGEGGTGIIGESNCCNFFSPSVLVRDEEGGCKDNRLVFVCIDCGNGECGPGETLCNCYEDCEGIINETSSE